MSGQVYKFYLFHSLFMQFVSYILDDLEEKLVVFVESRPALWDNQNLSYRRADITNEIWSAIANTIGCTRNVLTHFNFCYFLKYNLFLTHQAFRRSNNLN